MDVMRTPVFRQSCFKYRINSGDAASAALSAQIDEDYPRSEEPLHDDDDLDKRIVEHANGTYIAELDVAPALFKFIIGSKGDTKKKLEFETKCQINIPYKGGEGPIVVTGPTKLKVNSAVVRIESLANSSRAKLDFTHFVSIPFNQETIQTSFYQFKQQVLQMINPDGEGSDATGSVADVDEGLFQTASKLHLTVCTLTLLSEAEVERAVKILHSCKQLISSIVSSSTEDKSMDTDPGKTDSGYKLALEGLDYMNDDPSAVDVLYAKIKDVDSTPSGDRIQKIADCILTSFSGSDIQLLSKNFSADHVKMHVTLMNSLFKREVGDSRRRGGAGGGASGGRRKVHRLTFNARPILKEFGRYKFGEVTFPGVHLSQRYSTACDGYYVSTASIHTDITAGCSITRASSTNNTQY